MKPKKKKLTNREREEYAYVSGLKIAKLEDSEELQMFFKLGCTFGFALAHPVQFKSWEEAFRTYKKVRDEE